MRQVSAPSYPVSVFIAGDFDQAKEICRKFCDEEGLCVTVAEAAYIYTGGEEAGVIVGLINYPRFPKEPNEIDFLAGALALELMDGLEQQSVSIQTPRETRWFSIRAADLGLSPDGRRMAETENTGSGRKPDQQVPGSK